MDDAAQNVASLKNILGQRAGCLNEEEYLTLMRAGYTDRRCLLQARERTLQSLALHPMAVKTVLKWQKEQEPPIVYRSSQASGRPANPHACIASAKHGLAVLGLCMSPAGMLFYGGVC